MFYKVNLMLKNSLLYKKKMFKINLSKSDLRYINILLQANIVKWVKKNESVNSYYVYITYFDKRPIFSNIINFHKPSKPTFINWKNLKKTILKKNKLFIISTNQGILTSFKAYEKRLGGKIISQIMF